MKITGYSRIMTLLGLGVLFQSCNGSSESKKPKRTKAQATLSAPAYQLAPVSRQRVSESVQLPGEFRAYQEVSIFPRASGFVERVLVDRGTAVRRGQVLMVLDAPETEERLVAARSNTLKAEAMLTASREHYRRLLASNKIPGSVSALDLETAQARLRADSASVLGERASYRALTKLRDYLKVRAPFDGIITERNVHPGALVGSGAKQEGPMLVLQQQNRLRLVADVPETYSVGLREGSPIRFTVSAMPGRAFTGKISRRSGSMNQQFRSETVEIDVPNGDRTLRPGMFTEITLPTTGTPGALAVPTTAVVTSTERQYVIRVADGRAQYVPVRKGQKAGGMTEVFGALRPTDQIVVNARDDIKEGVALR
ncbi:efflux RND transporter periplasmic adaptor subunit [Fibrivirga algicola]|jgi:membrane fusion protein (multidrug efflux system)|uniref:Efflux RND transporter periplasmic adaptor subunit n=1 Tax=Fibrivirga algicola TaxID=2950420 RepID=A0ABX0QTT4_9BACT|nr:efflux RND transporter periplasmic adaptor subunit [Fibrivirga algicola]NID13604.1 efflux RND transporter periplasmic adaptor subunit [Fibrivirga algicola]